MGPSDAELAWDRNRTARRVVVAARHAPPALVERLGRDADPVPADATVLKRGDRCTVVRIDDAAPDAGGRLVLKRYNLKGPGHTAVHTVLRTRAAWAWRNGRRLRAAGLATPEPLAYAEERRGPLRLRSWLLTTFVEGPTLLDHVRQNRTDVAGLEPLAAGFAEIWRRLGSLRAGHDDMKATNFIVGPDQRLWLIDLDGMRIGLPPGLYGRARRNDLARFMRNWQDQPEVAALFRARIDTA